VILHPKAVIRGHHTTDHDFATENAARPPAATKVSCPQISQIGADFQRRTSASRKDKKGNGRDNGQRQVFFLLRFLLLPFFLNLRKSAQSVDDLLCSSSTCKMDFEPMRIWHFRKDGNQLSIDVLAVIHGPQKLPE
jgi:hypothetical protein